MPKRNRKAKAKKVPTTTTTTSLETLHASSKTTAVPVSAFESKIQRIEAKRQILRSRFRFYDERLTSTLKSFFEFTKKHYFMMYQSFEPTPLPFTDLSSLPCTPDAISFLQRELKYYEEQLADKRCRLKRLEAAILKLETKVVSFALWQMAYFELAAGSSRLEKLWQPTDSNDTIALVVDMVERYPEEWAPGARLARTEGTPRGGSL
ncbi:hypothetical protein BJ508DRAFT_313556 [Ascobolus immersus RN42]|uniref:Uncharacterized protein n=1 Tax=Ascobolus immersus RN42 TaxID=1160509 RepID=A0A3N4HLC2_ASCIM|nr:hypothetical protein BJ508DRAFT_313556 [Ascobolus immersus RN42]